MPISAKSCNRDGRFIETKELTSFFETSIEARRLDKTHIVVAKDKKTIEKEGGTHLFSPRQSDWRLKNESRGLPPDKKRGPTGSASRRQTA